MPKPIPRSEVAVALAAKANSASASFKTPAGFNLNSAVHGFPEEPSAPTSSSVSMTNGAAKTPRIGSSPPPPPPFSKKKPPEVDLDEDDEADVLRGLGLFADGVDDRPFIKGYTVDPKFVCMADVEEEEVHWLWPGRIARKKLTLLAGVPGQGKSFVTLDLAARVSQGASWPDGLACDCGSVVLMSSEDGLGDTIKKRLVAAGADHSRIYAITGVVDNPSEMYGGPPLPERVATLADIDAIKAVLQTLKDKDEPASLLIVDPVGSYLGGKVDAHRDNEVRSVLAPLAALAAEFDVAIVCVCHYSKSRNGRADEAVLGSVGFSGISRGVLHLLRDEEDPDRRVLLSGKTTNGKEPPGLAFRITDKACLAWEPESIPMTADQWLAAVAAKRKERKSPQLDHAKEWLRNALKNGARTSKDVYDAWEQHGGASRTLESAKQDLGVKSTRTGRVWCWTPPPDPTPPSSSSSAPASAVHHGDPSRGGGVDDAVDWLRRQLDETEMTDAAKQQGTLVDSIRRRWENSGGDGQSLLQASKELGVKSRLRGGATFWKLPSTAETLDGPGQSETVQDASGANDAPTS